MVQRAQSKRRRNRASSLATNEEAPEVAESTCSNSEIRVLDDSFSEQQQEEAGADRPTTLGKKRVRLHFDGGRRVFRWRLLRQINHRVTRATEPRARGRASSSRTSAIFSSSIASSLSSATDLEEERRKEFNRSEFSLDGRRARVKPSQREFAETTCGSHERLLLVNALPLDSDDEDNSSTTRHLPYRKTMIHGRVYLLKNQWV
ncbi:hypothetical protein PF005_g14686 [Phytophthora fragariae]|uniref:Uncharacterized protein n=1 Tax=Phytophthora fragariae TaxID=53985 RepID=A0A6A3R8H9_9STRA|nr:hypothetical protein PF003_g33264 [Phytophthora fragariae]KAE8929700.1 hypothetical protein PF009_g20193 [Phytophthora fragariae]KAE8988241.1 hypothetical protein PF011_g19246 [Phytophthora fragariae]KAE9086982.1 hypothetical protein PF010_g19893 [Phytophthora fragariae]KAE9091586.1 hypothetical protein PF007_g18825 [Phytophthora fragariae]